MAWPNGTRYKNAASNGNWTPTDMNGLQDQVLQVAGHRGAVSIATEEARTNTAFGLLATPDRVDNIVMPTDGLIAVGYIALWKNSVSEAGRAAIFLDSVAVQQPNFTGGALVDTSLFAGPFNVNRYAPLSSGGFGIDNQVNTATDSTAHVTTGQVISSLGSQTADGLAYIWAAAGTYDVSIQFRATSGTVTVKERKLWVSTLAFD